MVWLNGEHTLLLVQIQDITVQVSILRIVYCVIKQGDVSFGLDMLLDQPGKICGINHIIRGNYHIRMMHFFDTFHIFIIGSNIGVIDIVSLVAVSEKNLQPSAL